MRRALAVTLVVLVSPACGAGETGSEGAGGCTSDLGSVSELQGATWSPDGRRIAFSASERGKSAVYAVTVADCGVERLGPRANMDVGSLDWSSANVIAFERVYASRDDEGIYTMAVDGSHVRRVTDGPDLFPEWSPDGARIAFVRGGFADVIEGDPYSAYSDRNVWVVKRDGSDLRQVTEGPWHGTVDWSPDGKRLVTNPDPNVIELGVYGRDRRVLLEGEYGDPSWSPDGKTLVVAVGVSDHSQADWGVGLAEEGKPPVEPLGTPVAFLPEWSPDGEWIAFTDGEGDADLWVVRSDGTGLRQLTTVG